MSKRAEQLQREYLARLQAEGKIRPTIIVESKPDKERGKKQQKKATAGKRIRPTKHMSEFYPQIHRGTDILFYQRWYERFPRVDLGVDLTFLK